MTTATEGPATATFVVRPNRPQGRRLMRLQVASSGFLFVISVARAFTDEGWWAVASAVAAVAFVVIIGYQVFWMRRLLAADALLEVASSGLRVNHLGRGWVDLPWEDVTSAREDIWGRVAIRSTRGRRRLLVPARLADHDAGQILAGVHHFSGGRL